MRNFLAIFALGAFLSLGWTSSAVAAASKKKPASKTAPAKATSAKKSPPKRTPSKTASARNGRKKGPANPGAKKTTWRNRQSAPTPERYREIQDALAAKGYLPAEEVNGVWGSSSVDALRRFQADQKIESSGKINSLSLIALGLGPKHDAALKPVPAPAVSGSNLDQPSR